MVLGLISDHAWLVSADADHARGLAALPQAEGKEITVSLPSEPILVGEGEGSVAIPVTFRLTGDTDTFGGAIVIYEAEGFGKHPAVNPDDWEYDPILREGDDEIYPNEGFVSTDPVLAESIRLPIVDDREREGDETLVVSLRSPTPGNPTKDRDLRFILEPRSVIITILDNDPPAQPTGLTLVQDGTQVILNWDDSKDATVIMHQYSQDGGRSWVDVPKSAPGEDNAASYTVTGLMDDVDYSFAVRAVNSAGNRGNSVASGIVTTGSDLGGPALPEPAPTTLTAPADGVPEKTAGSPVGTPAIPSATGTAMPTLAPTTRPSAGSAPITGTLPAPSGSDVWYEGIPPRAVVGGLVVAIVIVIAVLFLRRSFARPRREARRRSR